VIVRGVALVVAPVALSACRPTCDTAESRIFPQAAAGFGFPGTSGAPRVARVPLGGGDLVLVDAHTLELVTRVALEPVCEQAPGGPLRVKDAPLGVPCHGPSGEICEQ
jgi:hypothetical protein